MSILQWLELLLAIIAALALAPELREPKAWQAWRVEAIPRARSGRAAVSQLPAREAAKRNPFQIEADLREIQDQLADASLAQFNRQNDLSKLEDSRRQDRDRAADLRTRIEQVSRDLITAREERDAASREALGGQVRQDAIVESQAVAESERLSRLEADLADRNVAARVALDRVLFLESLNYESDELAAARERSRMAAADRDRLAAEVEQLRTDLRLKELAAAESRDWSVRQQQSDLFRNFEERVRQLQTQSAALQDELDTIELRDEQNRDRVSQLDEEQRRNQRQIDDLEEQRSSLMTELRGLRGAPPVERRERPS